MHGHKVNFETRDGKDANVYSFIGFSDETKPTKDRQGTAYGDETTFFELDTYTLYVLRNGEWQEGGVVPTPPEPETKEFTVTNNDAEDQSFTYEFEDGMTWDDFIESDYHVSKDWIADKECKFAKQPDGGAEVIILKNITDDSIITTVTDGTNDILSTDIISENTAYAANFTA